MSYDLYAFAVPAGMTAGGFAESGERETGEEGPPTGEQRAGMERAAEALLAVDPAAERDDGDDWIEINADAMQVSLFAREAAISMPYWGGDADAVMERAFAYARVLRETLGYTVWDPQTETVVGDEPDRGPAAEVFATTSERVDALVAPPRRPWWKIWA